MALMPARCSSPIPVVLSDEPPSATGASLPAGPGEPGQNGPAPLTFTVGVPAEPSWDELLGLR